MPENVQPSDSSSSMDPEKDDLSDALVASARSILLSLARANGLTDGAIGRDLASLVLRGIRSPEREPTPHVPSGNTVTVTLTPDEVRAFRILDEARARERSFRAWLAGGPEAFAALEARVERLERQRDNSC